MGDLKKMLNPRTIALIGASERPDALGKIIVENLLHSGQQTIFLVNPMRDRVLDIACYPRISDIEGHVDLAVIATRAPTVAQHLDECGKAGVDGAIIVSAGFRDAGANGERLEHELQDVIRAHGIRVLGPNCLGLVRPNIGLNASLLRARPRQGNIAFISQGNKISDAVVDWQISAHIGFSMFASLGSMIDIGFGDLIDIVGDDDDTKSIMLYMEHVGNARKFLSAARGFARSKPIVVMKSGMFARSSTRNDPGKPPQWNRCDQVYDAAFKRAGIVRVKEVADLFNVSQVLNYKLLPKGPRLTIITNAEDAAIIATDTLLLMHGELAELSEETTGALNAFLPESWSSCNPVYIPEDARAATFEKTIDICLKDRGTDGILVIYAPQVLGEEAGIVKAVIGLSRFKPILCTILGAKTLANPVNTAAHGPAPIFNTPEEAVRTYLYMYKYKRNLELLYETPPESSPAGPSPRPRVSRILLDARSKGLHTLVSTESLGILSAYGVPALRSVLTTSVEDALGAADDIGYPVFLKAELSGILTVEKSLVAWARSPDDLKAAYERLASVASQRKSDPVIGITVRKMLEDIDFLVRVGSRKDKDFGSVIVLGMGGISGGLFSEFAVGFPPFNHVLARRLMEETALFRSYPESPDEPVPPCVRELEATIVNISRLVVDFPEISRIEANPIAVSNGSIHTLDARIVLEESSEYRRSAPYSHLVISPYPSRYVRTCTLSDGTEILLRPIKPEDEPLYLDMLNSLTEETMRRRFFGLLKYITHDMMARFCNVDYDREIAMVAESHNSGSRKIIGVGTLIIENTSRDAQFAVLVHDDFHRKGLGGILMNAIIGVGRDRGLRQIYGHVLTENTLMLEFCRKMGFSQEHLGGGTSSVTLDLRPHAEPGDISFPEPR